MITAFGLLRDVALGVLEDHRYQRAERVLYEGEALVFYTDGVTEVSSPGEELFDETRFEQLLTTHRDHSIDVMSDKIVLALSDFQKGNQLDGITLMMHQGRIIDDIDQKEKLRLTVDDLLDKFSEVRKHEKLTDDIVEQLRREYL
jgi:hypothetical protein